MATNTPNLNLVKPATSDKMKDTITDLASNMDTLDSHIHNNDNQIGILSNKSLNSVGFYHIDGFPKIAPETTDSPRVQRALNQAQTDGGGIVYLPRASYQWSTSVSIPSDSVKLLGDGEGLTVLTATSAIVMIQFNGNQFNSIVGMTIDGAGLATYGIKGSLRYAKLSFLWIKNCTTGLSLSGVSEIELEKVLIPSGCNVNCEMINGGTDLSNVTVLNCDFANATTYNLHLVDVREFRIIGGSIDGLNSAGNVGILIESSTLSAYNYKIDGVHFEGTSTSAPAIQTKGSTQPLLGFTIENCGFIQAGTCVQFDYGDEITFENNFITSTSATINSTNNVNAKNIYVGPNHYIGSGAKRFYPYVSSGQPTGEQMKLKDYRKQFYVPIQIQSQMVNVGNYTVYAIPKTHFETSIWISKVKVVTDIAPGTSQSTNVIVQTGQGQIAANVAGTATNAVGTGSLFIDNNSGNSTYLNILVSVSATSASKNILVWIEYWPILLSSGNIESGD